MLTVTGFNLADTAKLTKTYQDTLDRLPWRIHEAVKNVQVYMTYEPVRSRQTGFYDPNNNFIEMSVEDKPPFVPKVMDTLAHEYWHAYTELTDLWNSDEFLELARSVDILDEWRSDKELLDMFMRGQWGSYYFDSGSGGLSATQIQLEERMAEALAKIVMTGNGYDFEKYLGDRVRAIMELYIIDKIARSGRRHK